MFKGVVFVILMVFILIYANAQTMTSYDARGNVYERKIQQGNTVYNQKPDGSYTRSVIEGTTETVYDSRGNIKSQETIYGGSVVNRDPSGKVLPPQMKYK
jgi:ABC-type oligopeptide transport system substrate-binding subunit